MGNETHQQAGDGTAPLTTSQGIPVSDDQNTLQAGPRGPALLEDFPRPRTTTSGTSRR